MRSIDHLAYLISQKEETGGERMRVLPGAYQTCQVLIRTGIDADIDINIESPMNAALSFLGFPAHTLFVRERKWRGDGAYHACDAFSLS